MDKFVEHFKEYLDTKHNISISKEFIQTVVNANMTIDIDINHVVFKNSDKQFTYINTLFKNIFGSPLTILVNSCLKWKNDSQPNSQSQQQSLLLDKIKKLEKEIENHKETIDELRDAYVRVKRENERLVSKKV
jgi:hypothetical protein